MGLNVSVNSQQKDLRIPVAATMTGYIYCPTTDGKSVVCTTNLNDKSRRVVMPMHEENFREWCVNRKQITPIYEGDSITIQF